MGHYERLSALDASFLDVETRSSSMTVGAVLRFGPGPLIDHRGAIDIDKLRARVAAAVAVSPRYRQRIARVPGIGQPVWIDDEHFLLDFHLRHVRLPVPGTQAQLDQLVGVLFSQRMDRDHPLWRAWVVEGLESGGFALVMQAHHAMVDGVGGMGLVTSLLSLTPRATESVAEAPAPRPPPRALELVRDEIRYHNRRVAEGAKVALHALREGGEAGARLATAARGILDTVRTGFRPAPATPLNPAHIGPHRRFDTLRLELARVKRVKAALGGTVNDVVLATVTGALRRFLSRRGVVVDHLRDLRALVPVNTRPISDTSGSGNRVALMLAPLPVEEPDPAARLELIRAAMVKLKAESGQALGSALAEDVADAIATSLLTNVLRLAVKMRSFNVTVTNVPGPQVPLYLAGSRLEAIYPKVPLYETQAVGFALFSYDGGLYVGLSACWRAMPDLHDLVGDLEASFAELEAVAAHAVATAGAGGAAAGPADRARPTP